MLRYRYRSRHNAAFVKVNLPGDNGTVADVKVNKPPWQLRSRLDSMIMKLQTPVAHIVLSSGNGLKIVIVRICPIAD